MIVRFANRHCLKIAMRGQGHATLGNAQVSSGIVVDSTVIMMENIFRHLGPHGRGNMVDRILSGA